jgi:tRNA(Ile2) C34 agmatinyltransferase TiaS
MSLFLAIAIIVAVYLISLGVHPWWSCPRCGGSEVSQGRGRSHGRCLRCRGRGRYPRIGVRVLAPGTARKMLEGKEGRFF